MDPKAKPMWLRYLGRCLFQNIEPTVEGFREALSQDKSIRDADGAPERFLGEFDGLPEPRKGLVSRNTLDDGSFLLRHEFADWQHTDPDIQAFAAYFVKYFRTRGVPVYVHSAFRTRQEQEALVAKGRSRASWPRAPHCQGKAVDLVHGRFHWGDMMTRDDWTHFGDVGKMIADRLGIDITWGGDWDFYDPAHWELTNWRDDIRHPKAGDRVELTPTVLFRQVQERKR